MNLSRMKEQSIINQDEKIFSFIEKILMKVKKMKGTCRRDPISILDAVFQRRRRFKWETQKILTNEISCLQQKFLKIIVFMR